MRKLAEQGSSDCIGHALRRLKRKGRLQDVSAACSLRKQLNCAQTTPQAAQERSAAPRARTMQGAGGYGAAGVPSGPVQVRRRHGRGLEGPDRRPPAAARAAGSCGGRTGRAAAADARQRHRHAQQRRTAVGLLLSGSGGRRRRRAAAGGGGGGVACTCSALRPCHCFTGLLQTLITAANPHHCSRQGCGSLSLLAPPTSPHRWPTSAATAVLRTRSSRVT